MKAAKDQNIFIGSTRVLLSLSTLDIACSMHNCKSQDIKSILARINESNVRNTCVRAQNAHVSDKIQLFILIFFKIERYLMARLIQSSELKFFTFPPIKSGASLRSKELLKLATAGQQSCHCSAIFILTRTTPKQ